MDVVINLERKRNSMKIHSIGGFAAFICAGTYIFGFALLVTVMAPSGMGKQDIDAATVVGFISAHQGIMIVWHTGIYILNALSLVVLVTSLSVLLRTASSLWGPVTLGFGLVWSTLVLGAGMIANVTVERVAFLAESNPTQAALVWEILHGVEVGLGGGNEIAGAVWIALASLASWRAAVLGKITIGVGILVGVAGICTLIPALGDAAGAVFGLGAIAWFIAVGSNLMMSRPKNPTGAGRGPFS